MSNHSLAGASEPVEGECDCIVQGDIAGTLSGDGLRDEWRHISVGVAMGE